MSLKKNKNKNRTLNQNKDEETDFEDLKRRSKSYNMIFIAISLLIFGILGMIVVTQMELQPGSEFSDFEEKYPFKLKSMQGPTLNFNGGSFPLDLVLCHTDTESWHAWEREYPLPNLGLLMLFDSKTGDQIGLSRPFNGPIKSVFPIIDMNGDGVTDYLIKKATVAPMWELREISYDRDRGELEPQLEAIIDEDAYENKIINGLTLADINGINYSIYSIVDVVSLGNLTDSKEDLIFLEAKYDSLYLTTYFINGTNVINKSMGFYEPWGDPDTATLPKIELFNCNGSNHLLFVNKSDFIFYNLSSPNFNDKLYNRSVSDFGEEDNRFLNYQIIEDLDSDGNNEIILVKYNGNCSNQVILLNGSTGQTLFDFENFAFLPASLHPRIEKLFVKEIGNHHDGRTYILIEYFGRTELTGIDYFELKFRFTSAYMVGKSGSSLVYVDYLIKEDHVNEERQTTVLDQDLNFDGVNEIITIDEMESTSMISPMTTYRITIKDLFFGKTFSSLNLNTEVRSIQTIKDFDGDGIVDLLASSSQSFSIVSSQEPVGMFLSSAFPYNLGIPLFVLLVSIIIIGIILLIYYGGKFRYSVEPIKDNLKALAKKKKMTIFTIVISLITISITFFLFMTMLNVFNTTLVAGSWISEIIINVLIIMIVWFGLLTLTAAIYNLFAPYFAYIFIKLRALFFKVSRAYTNEFYVMDLKERKKLGTFSKLKRVMVPLLLSLAIGFYAYNYLAPFFGYNTTFATFSVSEFGSFIVGYMLLCILPLILSFLAFSFFNSGNYLLDDAGIVYYREPKRYRKPADIEPVSIWAQSLVKGAAGISALITFIEFAITLDVQTMVSQTGEGMLLLMVLLLIIFWGLPFITGFAYILLAEELMDFSTEYNNKHLYKLMEKGGIDATPREITIEDSKRAKKKK